MKIDNQFDISQQVYLKTDEDQKPRIVTGIRVRPGGVLMYDLSSGTSDTFHFEFEITAVQDIMTKTSY